MKEALFDARLHDPSRTGKWGRGRDGEFGGGWSHISEQRCRRRAPAEEDAASPDGDAFTALTAIAANRWRALAERAIEPNGYYLPDWALAVNAFASGRTGVSTLAAEDDAFRNTARRG